MAGPNSDFKGFEEDFTGFPKHLPDDCVEYCLYVIDSKLKTPKELLGQLEVVKREALKLTDNLLKEYIWQRENFTLEIESGKGEMHLHGLTNYGDSVEDEWLIVYILREISKKFPQLWIKVVDTDGEFLLAEAANALPRWLSPEIADNRVWIHNNALRIIPLIAAPCSGAATAPNSRPLTLEEAHEAIISTPDILIHSPLIEEEAFYRLRNYPAQINASLHHAVALIPRKLAYVLHARPTSIAPAVEAFYLRDPIALKPLQNSGSDLVFPPYDLVAVSIRFTRVLYAQLKSQQFPAPVSWKDTLLGAETSAKNNSRGSKSYDMLDMGMKVTSGFEMLLSDPKYGDNRTVREAKILLDDLTTEDALALPTDEVIAKWKDIGREDDESWMDITFEDFERELKGEGKQKSSAPGVFGPEPPSGFGDSKTQADLRKMVERFESFLNDENAGIDGAEMADMELDDEEEEDTDLDSEDEDKNVSFDEKEFARMMREMMGMPCEEQDEVVDPSGIATLQPTKEPRVAAEVESSDEENIDEASEMRKVMERLEVELNEAGALNLDTTTSKLSVFKEEATAERGEETTKNHHTDNESNDEYDDEEIDIDFNLAKNLLESFKSQAGMAGPGGNLLGLLGMQLPRDEDSSESAKQRTG
ncbi:SGT1-domain-containing protein [Hyaloscypha variabilis F]|uniref:SGT1-domain-containing protein n=1 Tax=Hyaloscypha variabilis (strain UAMH 11265 / GT02V1 / F) TaxID=1149755 RepID=A0A2J6RVL9_HYAVF|nr:SGT1-domain-containing protein [Hyaloscypha variabilis F]